MHPLIGEAYELNGAQIFARTIVAAGRRGSGFRAGETNGRVFDGGVVEVTGANRNMVKKYLQMLASASPFGRVGG